MVDCTMKAKAILTDIEGTTSSISFVRDVLFPYAAQRLPMFVRANARDPAVMVQLHAIAQEIGVAKDDYEAIIAALLQWTAEDRKATPLKALQGMLWEHGYKSHAYSACVSRCVPAAKCVARCGHTVVCIFQWLNSGAKIIFWLQRIR